LAYSKINNLKNNVYTVEIASDINKYQ